MIYDSFKKATKIGDIINYKMGVIVARIAIALKSKRILDVGYGNGHIHQANVFLPNRFFSTYDTVEPNEKLRNVAVANGVNNAYSDYLPSNKIDLSQYDVVILSHVLEHTSHVDAIKILSEISRYVIVIVPDFCDWKDDFYNGDHTHTYETTYRRICKIGEDAGLKMINYGFYRGCFKSRFFVLVDVAFRIFFGALHNITNDELFFKAKIMFHRNILITFSKGVQE